MRDEKEKKVLMFLRQDGKCEYCGRDMVLCFADYCNIENLATFDHKYNRDHELRRHKDVDERRIFIVCKKCNHERSKTEPNNQELNTTDKTVKKIVPKERWSDEKLIERIKIVVDQERELAIRMSQIDKDFKKLLNEKLSIRGKLSKKAKYRNLLMCNMEEERLQINIENQ